MLQALQVLEEMSCCLICSRSLCKVGIVILNPLELWSEVCLICLQHGAPQAILPLLHAATEEDVQRAALRVFRNIASNIFVDDVVRGALQEVAEEARVQVYKIREGALATVNEVTAQNNSQAVMVDPGADFGSWLSFGIGCADPALQVCIQPLSPGAVQPALTASLSVVAVGERDFVRDRCNHDPQGQHQRKDGDPAAGLS